MSREIKFRVYWQHGETGHISTTYTDNAFQAIYPPSPRHVTVALTQYTGLKDKNADDVYEGDVVKFSDNLSNFKDYTGYVGFMNGSFVIKGETINHYRWIDYDVEVIGNIYDNPVKE